MTRSDMTHASMRTPPALGEARDLAKKQVRRKGRLFPRTGGWNESVGASGSPDSAGIPTVLSELSVSLESVEAIALWSLTQQILWDKQPVHITALLSRGPADQLLTPTGVGVGARGDRRMSMLWLLKSFIYAAY